MAALLTVRLPQSSCPECSHVLDAATGIAGPHIPSAGDISICINCYEYLEFTDDLSLRRLPDHVYYRLSKELRDGMQQAVTHLVNAKRETSLGAPR